MVTAGIYNTEMRMNSTGKAVVHNRIQYNSIEPALYFYASFAMPLLSIFCFMLATVSARAPRCIRRYATTAILSAAAAAAATLLMLITPCMPLPPLLRYVITLRAALRQYAALVVAADTARASAALDAALRC